jgi:hypothetical protein
MRNFNAAVGVFESAFANNTVSGRHGTASTLAKMLEPLQVAWSWMKLTMTELCYGAIQSFADFLAVWHAHQCAVAEVKAFVYFCYKILSAGCERNLVEGCLWHQHLARCGVLLIDKEIGMHNKYFCRLGMPVYAIVHDNVYAQPGCLWIAQEP